MPRIIYKPPDPATQSFLDFVSRLQEERYRREQERAQEREAQKQRLIVGAGLALGAVGGAFLAPAAVASSATTGAALTATGASATGALISSTLTGASIGAQIGQQFAGGDIAGGVTTAASAASGIMQSMEDQELYGYSPSKQERSGYIKQAAKLGTNMGYVQQVARQSNMTIPEVMQIMQVEQADEAQLEVLARERKLGVSGAFLKEKGETYPGGIHTLMNDLEEERGQIKAQAAGQQRFATTLAGREAEAQQAAQVEKMELRYDPRALAQRSADLKAINLALESGDLTLDQATQQIAAMPRLIPTLVPRRTPRTIEEDETISSKTGLVYVPDTRGGRRHVGSVRADDNVAEVILKHHQAMSKATFGETSMDDAAADYVAAQRIADQIKAGAYQPGGAVQAPQRGAPAPGQLPQAAQNVELQKRIQAAAQVLTKVMPYFPDDPGKWVPEMKERFLPAARLVNRALLDKMKRGGMLTPEEAKLLRFAARLLQGS